MNEKRILLFGVLNACPLNNPDDSCPFGEIRKKPVNDRWRFVNELPENEVESLLTIHKRKLYQRELDLLHESDNLQEDEKERNWG